MKYIFFRFSVIVSLFDMASNFFFFLNFMLVFIKFNSYNWVPLVPKPRFYQARDFVLDDILGFFLSILI